MSDPTRKRTRVEHQKRRRMMQNHHQKNKENIVSVDYYNNAAILDDDLVVSQILSRLPVNSLMRCKCVCKGWKSIIEHDSHFVNLHHTHSQARPVLLIATQTGWDPDVTRKIRFFSADLEYDSDGDNVIGANLRTTVRRLNTTDRVEQLGPVRGLVCLVDRSLAVQIYNVSTGQALTPWIKSPAAYDNGYHFGFDPRSGKHKLVTMWNLSGESPVCAVLTVGDTRWRIIDDAPPPYIRTYTSVYANGSVYWIAYSSRVSFTLESEDHLLAFDVGPEKFRMIPIPKFKCVMYPPYCMKLMDLDGFPTVVHINHGFDPAMNIWKFHDHKKLNGTEEEDWTNVTLPSYLDVSSANIYPIAGKDLMIIETYPRRAKKKFRRNVNLIRFYSYNLTKNTLRKFEIQGISSVRDDCRTLCSTLVESLWSVAES